MSKPVATDLDEEEALREVVNALRADNGRLLRLLIASFVSDGRPEHEELTAVLSLHPNLRNWLGTSDSLLANQNQASQRQNNDRSSTGQTTIKARHRRGRRGKRRK